MRASDEPVVLAATGKSLIVVLFALAASTGVLSIADDTRANVLELWAIVAPLLTAWWVRRKVSPV